MSYLDQAYAKTKADCKELFKDMEHMTALTIMSGGKTNNGRIPIVNYIAASPKGTHFLAADDMSNVAKDNVKMAKYLHEKCIETGFERSFYACVLDGALRSAFPHIEARMPWILDQLHLVFMPHHLVVFQGLLQACGVE